MDYEAKITKISLKEKIGYGFSDFGSQFVYTTTSLFLVYFLTDVALLTPALVGTIMLVTRIWDAVIDPLLGHYSDQVNTRWGQKRPFLLFSAVPLGLGLVLVFQVPNLGGQGKLIYYLLTTLFMWTFFSVFQIPSGALLPNLTLDAKERSSISGVAKGMSLIGLVVIGGVSPLIVDAFPSEKTGFGMMALIYGFIVTGSILIAFFSVKERVQAAPEERSNLREIFKLVIANKPFLILSANVFLVFLVFTITGAMINYFFEYNLQNADFVPVALTSIFGIAVICMPLWIWLNKKFGKKKTYMLSMGLYGVMFLLLYLVQSFNPTVVIPLFVFAGIGFSGINLGTAALLPDTVEYVQWKHGKRIEGVQNGISSFMTTLAASLGGFIIGMGLDISGYIANVEQTSTALKGIRVLSTLLPAGIMFLAMVVLHFYPITESKHQEILAQIEASKTKSE